MQGSKNPFRPALKRLKAPVDGGNQITIGEFELEHDAEGCVEVPQEHVATLMAHGYTEPQTTAAPVKSKK